MSVTSSPSSRRTRGRKRSRLRFAKRSSTEAPLAAPLPERTGGPVRPFEMTGRHIWTPLDTASKAGLLVVAFAAAALLALLALAAGSGVLTIVGLALAVALAGLLAAYLIVTERRRHEAAELELTSEARFLESLVETMGSIAGSPDVLERTRQEAERLFEARVRLLDPGERPRRAPAENAIIIPLQAHDAEIGALRILVRASGRSTERTSCAPRCWPTLPPASTRMRNCWKMRRSARLSDRSSPISSLPRNRTSAGVSPTSCTTARCRRCPASPFCSTRA